MDFPIENGDFSIVMLHVSLPEGKPPFSYGFPMVFPSKPPTTYGLPMVFPIAIAIIGLFVCQRGVALPQHHFHLGEAQQAAGIGVCALGLGDQVVVLTLEDVIFDD